MGQVAVLPGPHQGMLLSRIGLGASIIGRHAGLSPEEMLVPLLSVDLGRL